MKIDITKTDARIEITITGSDECVVNIKANNCTVITETENEIEKLQSNTDQVPSYRMYDTNPALFLDLYDEYMNGELTVSEIAKLLGCSIYTFRNAIKYYRDKENMFTRINTELQLIRI